MRNNELAKIVKKAREEKNISQRELARRIKIDNAEISRIEKGNRVQPNFYILRNLSKELDLDFKTLMEISKYNKEEIEILLPYKDIEPKPFPTRQWTAEEYSAFLNTKEEGIDLLYIIREFRKGRLSEDDFIYLMSKGLGVNIREHFIN